MSAVPVTIVGLLTYPNSTDGVPVTLVGAANITGLSVGGGPIVPGAPPGAPPRPTFPINLPPGSWWGGGIPNVPPGTYPPSVEHPIVIPPPPTEPPPDGGTPPTDGMTKPPPPEGGWGFHPTYGWGYFPAAGQPQPKG